MIKQEDNAFADLLTNTAEIPKWNFSKSLAHAIPNQKKPNIIILVMESVRSDAITQENMPFIAAMTQRSDQFLQAYTTKDHTSKALIGIFCGMYSKDDLAVSEDSNNNPLNCLPKYLGSNNYRVGYFQSADEKFEDRPRLLKLMGFSDWKALKDLDNSRFKYLGYFGIDDHAMLNPIQKWISQNPAGQPFFLGVLNVGTHHPYDLPGKKNPYPDDAQRSKEAYLETLRLYDDFVAKLVFWLEKKGILGNTMLVLTGDHGEAFQEHGLSTHGHVPYQEVARIPLIVHRPGQTIGRIDNQLRQHIDILPTVLSEAGYTPPAKVPGKVLYGPGHDQLYFSCWTRSDCIALIEPNRKYIYHFGKTSFEVFNSGMDPLEQNNIAEKIDNKTKKKALSTMLTYRRAISNFYSKEN
ncbi:hypothetical protein GCM10007860_11920 [Chitiniphilus shinanonensis]|uniref:Sulfatase N-terminal domain-containing protein n=1 Tax=Chitiniphilus shinanonensis TaxID=553088 RepID=A0ABQ6BU21_9NEIS|nr:hypothetical protein GCM10007860_11920 [Chitiniphilus shinanonensis]